MQQLRCGRESGRERRERKAPPRIEREAGAVAAAFGHRFGEVAVGAAPVVQRKRLRVPSVLSGRAPRPEAAAVGLAGAGERLPHFAAIQRSFGRHDLSRVEAHTGRAAAEGAAAMGAEAFASGYAVAFASAPSLRLAAHEAAHVVQQRAGLRPGADEERHERHADQVADAVAQGRSSEALLDRYQAAPPSPGGPAPVQRATLDVDPSLVDFVGSSVIVTEQLTEDELFALRKKLNGLSDSTDNLTVKHAAFELSTELLKALNRDEYRKPQRLQQRIVPTSNSAYTGLRGSIVVPPKPSIDLHKPSPQKLVNYSDSEGEEEEPKEKVQVQDLKRKHHSPPPKQEQKHDSDEQDELAPVKVDLAPPQEKLEDESLSQKKKLKLTQKGTFATQKGMARNAMGLVQDNPVGQMVLEQAQSVSKHFVVQKGVGGMTQHDFDGTQKGDLITIAEHLIGKPERAAQQLIVELTNLKNKRAFWEIGELAANQQIEQEDYVKANERIEYEAALNVHAAFKASNWKDPHWKFGDEVLESFETYYEFLSQNNKKHLQFYRDQWTRYQNKQIKSAKWVD